MKQRRDRFVFLISRTLHAWIRAYCQEQKIPISYFIHDALAARIRKLRGKTSASIYSPYPKAKPGSPGRKKIRVTDSGWEDLNQCIPDWIEEEIQED